MDNNIISPLVQGVTEEAGQDPSSLSKTMKSLWLSLIRMLPGLLPLFVLVGTGIYGLDFGKHWGEHRFLGFVEDSVAEGLLLPKDFYNYPSMSYWLTLSGIGPELLFGDIGQKLGANLGSIARDQTTGIRTMLRATISTSAYHLRVRGIFLVVSSLSVLWVYLIQLEWRRSWVESMLAASIIGFSWELAYHFRWIAPDGILVGFSALTLLFVMLSRSRPENPWWLWLAAMAAGLAFGTKYPAGLLLVPVLIAAYQSWDHKSLSHDLVPLLIKLILIFCATYLVTTPGTLLQPESFIQDVLYEVRHYQDSHFGHTVSAGFEHMRVMLSYYALTFLSHFEPIALLLFVFSLIGAGALLKESRQTAILFLSFPVVYVVYMSRQQVMIPRNLLPIAPFLAVLAARGIAWTWQRSSHRIFRAVLGTSVIVLLVANATWLLLSAESIHNRNLERFTREAASYVDAHPETQFFVSERVWDGFQELDGRQRPNVTRDPTNASDVALFYTYEGYAYGGMEPGVDVVDWPATMRDLTITWFGPWEVNMNYYPNWIGDDRILLMHMPRARELIFRNVQEDHS